MILSEKQTRKGPLAPAFALGLYVIILHVLFIGFYKVTFQHNYNDLLFIYKFSLPKYLFCLCETLCMAIATLKKLKKPYLSETIMLLLNLLYFIPGAVQQAVTDMDWAYIVFYFLFWFFMELWLLVIKPRKKSLLGQYFKARNTNLYVTVLLGVALLIVAVMFVHSGGSLSLSALMATFNDVYGVRAEAKSQNMHWLLLNFVSWSSYFLILAITYFSSKKKWVLAAVAFGGILALFLVQANRIIVFLAVAAFLISFLKLDNRKMIFCMLLIGVVLLAEGLLFSQGWIITDVFRRFSIVPNRLGEQYYDYFSYHTPDFLRSLYPRIASISGFVSEYDTVSVGKVIGEYYYGSEMNANTGLAGGAAYQFGQLGVLVSSLGYVLAFRLFEGAIGRLKNTGFMLCLAVLLATLAINTPSLLASVFGLTYFMFLYVLLVPVYEREPLRTVKAN